MTPLAEAAREYRAMGLAPIPVGRDKRPLVKWREYQEEPPHPDQIDEWWSRWPEANIGCVTGPVSELVVLDADGPEGLASLTALGTPATTWLSVTGRVEGGWQQFFRHPGAGVTVRNRAGLRPKLDVRGNGGYVILPPSLHASGRRYRWLTSPGEIPLAPLPAPLLDLLLTPDAVPAGAVEGRIPAGQRNDTLYRLGRSLVAKGLPPSAVTVALIETNRVRCAPPLSEGDVRVISDHVTTQPDRPGFGGSGNRGGVSSAVRDAERWAARVASITAQDIPALLDPTDHLMAVMFERFFAERIHTSPQYGVKSWNELVWVDDATHGRHRDFAIETVQTLMAAADTIPIPVAIVAGAIARAPTMSNEAAKAALRRTMRAKLKKWENGGRLNAMIGMASARKPFLADIGDFDQDPLALPVANGVLDLQTTTLMPARPEQKLTKALAVVYDPGARCPRFERFLSEIFPTDTADLVAFMQRLIGMCLTGLVKDHIVPFFWGEGSNGKTTLLTTLYALLGPFAVVAPLSLLLESKHRSGQIPNDVAKLFGKRLAVTEETPERALLSEATVKALTGGGKLTGRFLFHEYFDFDPTHKVMLVTNSKPVIRGQDHAIWRRVALVPFPVKFWKQEDHPPPGAPLQDPDLAADLLTELPGILRWALDGCVAWQRDGRLHLPKIVRAATAEYREEQDVLKPFLDEHCVIDPTGWVSTEDLYARYEIWATSAHERAMTKKALGMELAPRGFRAAKQAGVRGRQGLCLRS
jgi:putative DNA primase/helicase